MATMVKSHTITSSTRTHLTSAQVETELRDFGGVQEISDGAALTIASWYASPNGSGAVMAQLATTGTVDLCDLELAIGYEFRVSTCGDPVQELALDMLGTWAINHPSRLA